MDGGAIRCACRFCGSKCGNDMAALLRNVVLLVPKIRRLWNEHSSLVAEHNALKQQLASSGGGSPFFFYNSSFDAIEIIHRYSVRDLEPDASHLTNFLGVRIDPKFFPGILDGRENTVEPIPIPANWHADIAEWASALRAVDLANGTFRIVEVGCGWGCWLNNTGVAARSRGLKVDLVGIEGDEAHIAFAREALRTNGFSDDEYRIVRGVASPRRSRALFPIVAKAGSNWGSEPIFDASPEQIAAAVQGGTHQVLDALPLSELVEEGSIDLLHIDIQGGECDFVISNFFDINRLVRRLLIGTHSRVIEGKIFDFLLAHGWKLEMERPCVFALSDGRPQIRVDGVQLWCNPGRA